MRSLRRLAALAPLTFGLAACAPQETPPAPAHMAAPAPPPAQQPPAPVLPPERPPLGQLPPGVRPLHYTLALQIVPGQERFAGTVEIAVEIDRPRTLLWLHANGLSARHASVRPDGLGPVGARFEQVDPVGVASLTLDRPVGPGRATIRVDYDGPLSAEARNGLYKVQQAGKAYAFTQFEAIAARNAFPGFDEPAYKTPFAVSLFVPRGEAAISSTAEIERVQMGDLDRVTFATTAPIPTYLLAFAVGPLDIVNAAPVPPNAVRQAPLPLRGAAAQGRGPELAYALENTGALVAALEEYTSIPYPFQKLDIIAVPDRRGAMENVGAVTFGEFFLLMDRERAPAEQRRRFFGINAHELAHMWFGDLVTMPWWNDLWLKEASANWLGTRAVSRVRPDLDPESAMLERVHEAMSTDGMVSARKIRQEIRDHHDIFNAYDGITYDKGYAVITMFERWMGRDLFQRGVRSFLGAHSFGAATVDDYLNALSQAKGSDVAAAFRTFLDQPGVPLVEARLACEGKPELRLKQSRYLPLGSAGDPAATWQVPVCVRYPADAKSKDMKESCALLAAAEGSLPLEGDRCPAWVLPNADGAGYYRWSVPAAELKQLATAALPRLTVRERMSFAASVRAAFGQGKTSGADALAALAPLAADPRREVATAPMALLDASLDWLAGDPLAPAAAAYAQALYAPAYRDLGWAPRPAKPVSAAAPTAPAEPAERALLRRDVIDFLALEAQDPGVRKEAAARGRAYVEGGRVHPEAVTPDLAEVAIAVAIQESDAALFDRALAALERTDDEVARSALVRGLGSARAPDLAARARELVLDARVRPREAGGLLQAQLAQPETREAAWRWMEERMDALVARLTPRGSGWLPWTATSFCDRAHADRASALFGPRVSALHGGPRTLAGALEAVNLCVARRKAQEPSLRAFFTAAGKPARAALKKPGR